MSTQTPLTERMRKSSRQVHDKSDKLVNWKLSLVLTSRPLYGEALALFAPIYSRIEANLDKHTDHPQLGKIVQHYLPVLRRAGAMEADMGFYLSAEQMEDIRTRQAQGQPPELSAYLARLDEVCQKDPVLLLAYAYHMYLALFAGGAQISKLVSKVFGVKDGKGVQTFCFPGLDGSKKTSFRIDFKAHINNEISVSEEEVNRLLEEGTRVFAQNNAVVATIQGSRTFATAAATFTVSVLKWSTVSLALIVSIWAYRRHALKGK